VIADLTFAGARGGVRRARFVPRANVPVDAACVVANGVREALRTLLGETCSVTLGEPVALDAPAWRTIVGDALLFATPGRATDVIFVLTHRDARRLVQAAFGEEAAPETASATAPETASATASADGAWSALESGAIQRIVARCANACDALCVERRGPTALVDAARVPRSVAYFDVRIAAPVTLTIGVGIVRELPTVAPAGAMRAETLGGIEVDVRVVLGRGTLTAPRLLELRTGSFVPISTKVAGEGELNLAGQRLAFGTCGVRNGRAAFEVGSVVLRGDAW
jgi:flagellar motor switch/type III secretory pathway protein FliN